MNAWNEIKITTTRLLLRHLRPGDAADLLGYRCVPEVYKYQTWRPVKLQDAVQFIQSTASSPGIIDSWYQLAICHRNDMKIIGDIGIHFLPPDAREIELGCTVKPEHQGLGYATEAMSSVIDYLFNNQAASRVICCLDPRNERSRQLMDKLGLKLHVKKLNLKISAFPDDLVFSIRANQWKPAA